MPLTFPICYQSSRSASLIRIPYPGHPRRNCHRHSHTEVGNHFTIISILLFENNCSIYFSHKSPKKKHPQAYLLRPNDMLTNALHILLPGGSSRIYQTSFKRNNTNINAITTQVTIVNAFIIFLPRSPCLSQRSCAITRSVNTPMIAISAIMTFLLFCPFTIFITVITIQQISSTSQRTHSFTVSSSNTLGFLYSASVRG